MPDRCTPEYERVLAGMGSALPYRRARTLLAELLPVDTTPEVETIRRRPLRGGARLERAALVPPDEVARATAITLAIDGGHVRSVRTYQMRSFAVMIARASNDQGQEVLFSSLPVEADRQVRQFQYVLRALETDVAGQADLIIDDDDARHRGEAISTATTESTVQRLLHRRMGANQQMRWSPRGAHRMLKVRTAVMNGTLVSEHTAAEPFARRPFRRTA